MLLRPAVPAPLVRSLAVAAALLTSTAAPVVAGSGFRLELEGGPVWQVRNDFAVPGDSGTALRLGQAPAAASGRLTLVWDFGRHWSLRALVAPLATETRFVSEVPVSFAGTEFPAGVPLLQRFEFDSYRLTLFRRFETASAWSLRGGFTAKVRDAAIRLSDGSNHAERDDLGLVPLLYGGARWDEGGRVALDLELDALAAPQGRAVDFSARVEFAAGARWRPYLGYRLLEGGADNDEVRTFSTFHFVFAGVSLRL
jgi:hypothetical protein